MSKSGLSERVTEDELINRAKAERVTLEQVEGSIEEEWYFTGSEAVKAGLGVGPEIPMTGINEDLSRVTICLLRMINGFVVLGHSAPASAANFDAEIGKRLARERAIMQIWQLLGFELKTRQWRQEQEARNQEGNSTSESPATNTSEGLATPGSKPKKSTGRLGAED